METAQPPPAALPPATGQQPARDGQGDNGDQDDQLNQIGQVEETDHVDQEARSDQPVQEAIIAQPCASSSISLGSCICGINVRLHCSMIVFTVIAMFLSLLDSDRLTLLFNFLLYGPILYLTALVHEFGHAFTALRLGGEVTQLILWPIGGLTVVEHKYGNVQDDVKVALAGPITHIPMVIFWFGILWLCAHLNGEDIPLEVNSSPPLFWGYLAWLSMRLNTFMFLANLCIPIYPFDGVRIISGMLILAGAKVSSAVQITALVGIGDGIAISCLGLIYYGVYYGLGEVLIGIMICVSSVLLFRMALKGELRNDLIFGRSMYYQEDTDSGADVEVSSGAESSIHDDSSLTGNGTADVQNDRPVINEIV